MQITALNHPDLVGARELLQQRRRDRELDAERQNADLVAEVEGQVDNADLGAELDAEVAAEVAAQVDEPVQDLEMLGSVEEYQSENEPADDDVLVDPMNDLELASEVTL